MGAGGGILTWILTTGIEDDQPNNGTSWRGTTKRPMSYSGGIDHDTGLIRDYYPNLNINGAGDDAK